MRQETCLLAAARNFFKTDHTSYFLILKNGVVKRRFFVPKNNFRPDKAPTHVGLCRIFSLSMLRVSVYPVHILDIVLLEKRRQKFYRLRRPFPIAYSPKRIQRYIILYFNAIP